MNSSRILATSWKHARRESASALSVAASVSLLAAVGIFDQPSRTKNEALQIRQSADSSASSTFDGLSPTPPIYVFRPNDNLEIAFDTRTRNPVYVMERLLPVTSTTTSSNQAKLRRPNFYEEKNLLPLEFRPRNSSYRNSGYDRGHLAASGNYMHLSQEEVNATFSLCNCSPQNSKFNAGIWAELERWTRKVAQENSAEEADTYVVTGPLWMPSRQIEEKIFQVCHDAIGVPPSLVSVPTHLFKVVVAICRRSNTITKFACFVIPNRDPDNNNKSSNASTNKRQSLEDLSYHGQSWRL